MRMEKDYENGKNRITMERIEKEWKELNKNGKNKTRMKRIEPRTEKID